MKTLCLILLSLSALAGASQPAPDLKIAEVVIRNISVLDVTAGAWLPHRDVIIRNGKIAAVQPAGSPLPASKFTINGDGKFADSRILRQSRAPQGFRQNHRRTICRVRRDVVWDRGTDATRTEEWRRDISYGKFMGPRIVRADAAGRPSEENRHCRGAARERPRPSPWDSTTNSPRACADQASRPPKCCGARRWTPRPFMAAASISVRSSRARLPTDRAQRRSAGQHRAHPHDRCSRVPRGNPDARPSQPTVVARATAAGTP